MPRVPRISSTTGIYHVMIRGINRQQIFEEEYDYIQFCKILYELVPVCRFQLYSFCIMSNHVHLLIKPEVDTLPNIMKKIETKFVFWYNRKYGRTGHLFEDRYKSEPIDDDRYFLTALRYILQNPVKAGLCSHIFEYPWSTAGDYLSCHNSIINVQKAQQYFNNSKELIDFLSAKNKDFCLEYDPQKILNAEQQEQKAKEMILLTTGCANVSDFQKLDVLVRNQYICQLSKRIPIRQLSRLIGLSKSQIQRIKMNAKKDR